MRYKEPFTIFPRKLKTATVYYYQCYDNNGRRTCGHSTGQRTRAAAKKYCMELYKEGKLIPQGNSLTFSEFAKGWWDAENCKYLKWRQMQNPLAPATIDHYKTALSLHILPFFGKMKINSIDSEHIRTWIMNKVQREYTNASINMMIASFKIMMKEAQRLKYITVNPAEKIKKLIPNNKEVQILSTEEVQKLLAPDWENIWESYEVYIFNKLAACTGMRLSEIIGLKSEFVFPDYIHVCLQYSENYGMRPLKTKDTRNVPITEFIYSELSTLIEKNKNGFVFSSKDGKHPISRNRVYRETGNAFDKIGIDDNERKRRRMKLHHWRHFLNTALLMANVNMLKVQKVTGHKSLSMTKHYTHFDSRDFIEVRDVQNNLFSVKE